MAFSAPNKRRHPRASLDTKVQLSGGGRGQQFEATVRSGDVSLGGIFFLSTFALRLGSALRARFDVPLYGTIEVEGLVVRVEQYDERFKKGRNGFALRFTKLASDDAVALSSIFVAPRARDFAARYLRTRSGARKKLPELEQLVDALVVWEMERESSSS